MKNEFYAHSLEGSPPEHWHSLEDHLKAVGKMARISAEFLRMRVDVGFKYKTEMEVI
jgi:hypothetical protein